ncbi:hypothetical protein BDI4_940008 [Burkholderia diffusa]|nr:hypothetical protein BDI4_940008 [Burkholderia diffusa]
MLGLRELTQPLPAARIVQADNADEARRYERAGMRERVACGSVRLTVLNVKVIPSGKRLNDCGLTTAGSLIFKRADYRSISHRFANGFARDALSPTTSCS